MVASATASYLASHLNPGTILAGHAGAALVQQSLVHGYLVGFWWTAGIFAAGAVVCGTLLRRGAAAPSAGTRRRGPGTKGCAAGTTVRSAEGWLCRPAGSRARTRRSRHASARQPHPSLRATLAS
jgi:membrane protein implicated in regulation of membrane protease activity